MSGECFEELAGPEAERGRSPSHALVGGRGEDRHSKPTKDPGGTLGRAPAKSSTACKPPPPLVRAQLGPPMLSANREKFIFPYRSGSHLIPQERGGGE